MDHSCRPTRRRRDDASKFAGVHSSNTKVFRLPPFPRSGLWGIARAAKFDVRFVAAARRERSRCPRRSTKFPPIGRKRAWVDDGRIRGDVRELGQGPGRVLGRAGQAHRLDQALSPRSRTRQLRPAYVSIKWFEDGVTQRRLQLHRPASADARATRPRSSGKATIPTTVASTSPIASCTSMSAASPMC